MRFSRTTISVLVLAGGMCVAAFVVQAQSTGHVLDGQPTLLRHRVLGQATPPPTSRGTAMPCPS